MIELNGTYGISSTLMIARAIANFVLRRQLHQSLHTSEYINYLYSVGQECCAAGNPERGTSTLLDSRT